MGCGSGYFEGAKGVVVVLEEIFFAILLSSVATLLEGQVYGDVKGRY